MLKPSIRNRILLYISAAPEQERERDLLGRAVSAIRTSLGWEVVQTPHRDQSLSLEALARADVHVLVLGEDIRAPVGLEWRIARSVGRTPVLFKQERLHTPAADAFIRELSQVAAWRSYQEAQGLARQVSALLVDYLLDHMREFALSAAEVEQLRDLQGKLASAAQRQGDEPRGGAGESGVILSRERYEPSTGKLVG